MALFRNRGTGEGVAWGNRLREYARQRFRSGILRNAAWMLSGRGMALAGRMIYFVIVAHVLGPAGYGTFVACTALMAAMAPFAAFGTGHVMVKYAARDRNALPAYLGNALLVTAIFGSSTDAAGSAASVKGASSFGDYGNADRRGRRRVRWHADDEPLPAGVPGPRPRAPIRPVAGRIHGGAFARGPVAVGVFHAHSYRLGLLYAASSAAALVMGLVGLSGCGVLPRLQFSLLLPSVREGAEFATTQASQSIYDDIDKTMLARLSTVEAAAIYAVACRFIDAASVPIAFSAAEATYREFFRKGMAG